MKKSLLIMTIFSILVINIYLINSADTNSIPSPQNEQTSKTINFQEKSNQALSKEVIIPENLQILARIVFGLQKDRDIQLQNFIVLVALWIMLFAIIKATTNFMPFFETDWKSWVVSIVITLIISTTGTIISISAWLFGFGGFFKNQSLLNLIFILIILAVLSFGVFQLLNTALRMSRIEEAHRRGMKTSIP